MRPFLSMLLSTAFLALAGPQAQCQQATRDGGGSLMISTRRIILQGRHRSGELYLMNASLRRGSYRIQVAYLDMNEKGEITQREAPKEGERPWTELLRFSPRQVTLEAGQSQTIRVAAMKPADLPAGEYRYHLTVVEMPEAAGPTKSDSNEGLQISIRPLFGITIPVIFRNGDLKATSGLTDLVYHPAAENQKASLTFWLTRIGDASSYGHLKATFFPTGGGAEETVAELKGVAVYTNLTRRALSLNLQRPGGMALGPGRLHLTFTPEGARSAEAQLDLPIP